MSVRPLISQHVRVQQGGAGRHWRPVQQRWGHAAAAAAAGADAALQHHRRRVPVHREAVSPIPAGPRCGRGPHRGGQDVPAAVRELRAGEAVRGVSAAAPLQVLRLWKLQVRQGQVSSTRR